MKHNYYGAMVGEFWMREKHVILGMGVVSWWWGVCMHKLVIKGNVLNVTKNELNCPYCFCSIFSNISKFRPYILPHSL